MTDQTTTVADLRGRLAQFVADRQWQGYHDAKNLAMAIAIEAAELMEHFQWVRSDEVPAVVANPAAREKIGEEIADVACYLLSLVNALDFDLAAIVEAKIRRNEQKYPADRFRGRYFKPGESAKGLTREGPPA